MFPPSMELFELKESLKILDSQRSNIEDEMKELMQVLNTPVSSGLPGVGLNGSLVDDQGYPRADIDLYQVRQHRHRVNCLQTDHKSIMQKIESVMPKIFQAQAQATDLSKIPKSQSEPESSKEQSSHLHVNPGESIWSSLSPFARVEGVLDGSPAFEGGLCSGDLIIRFKDVDHSNNLDLQALASVVRNNIGKPIPIEIIRDGEYIDSLVVQPHTWSGAGVVGCRFIPI